MSTVYALDTILHQGREYDAGSKLPDLDQEVADRLVENGLASRSKPDEDDYRQPVGDPQDVAQREEVDALRARVAELEAQLAEQDGGDNVDKLKKDELEKLAADRNIEVTGTGKDNAVTVEDLRKAIKAADSQ